MCGVHDHEYCPPSFKVSVRKLVGLKSGFGEPSVRFFPAQAGLVWFQKWLTLW